MIDPVVFPPSFTFNHGPRNCLCVIVRDFVATR